MEQGQGRPALGHLHQWPNYPRQEISLLLSPASVPREMGLKFPGWVKQLRDIHVNLKPLLQGSGGLTGARSPRTHSSLPSLSRWPLPISGSPQAPCGSRLLPAWAPALLPWHNAGSSAHAMLRLTTSLLPTLQLSAAPRLLASPLLSHRGSG